MDTLKEKGLMAPDPEKGLTHPNSDLHHNNPKPKKGRRPPSASNSPTLIPKPIQKYP